MENKSPAKPGLRTDKKGTKRDGGNALRGGGFSPICCASATLSIFHRPRPNSAPRRRGHCLCSWPWGEGEAAMAVGIARIAPGPFLQQLGPGAALSNKIARAKLVRS